MKLLFSNLLLATYLVPYMTFQRVDNEPFNLRNAYCLALINSFLHKYSDKATKIKSRNTKTLTARTTEGKCL